APRADLREGLGLRLRRQLERARSLRLLPAQKAGGRRGSSPHPHRSGRRLRPPGPMSFRSRLTLLGAAAVAVAVLVGALAIYVAVEQQLVGQVDANLTQLANDVQVQRVSGGRVYGHLPARSEEHTSELQSRENLVC